MRNVVIALTLALAVSACSGDDSSDVADAGAVTSTGIPEDPCLLVTDGEVESITGESPESHRGSSVTASYSNCQWSDGNSDFFTLTVQNDHDWDLLVTAANSRGEDDYRELDGVGDRAFVELEANVIAEQDDVAVTAQGQVDSVADLEALMPTILDRLG
jgi:hypothetical protein